MDSIGMLFNKIDRLEEKLDAVMPLVYQAKKIAALEKKVEQIYEIKAKSDRVEVVEKKVDEILRLKWQLVGGFAVISVASQYVLSKFLGA